jgi:glucokinase
MQVNAAGAQDDPVPPAVDGADSFHSARESARAAALPRPWIVADIGGTNARFGWLAASGAVEHVVTLRAADHAGPAEAAGAYLQQVAGRLGAAYRPPQAAAFAVATAIAGDRISFTNNSGWAFSRSATCSALDLRELLILNDFEALALSLPRLRPDQLRPWGGAVGAATDVAGAAPVQQALAVIGPGTGLGVAGIVPTRHGWVAIPGEGGHASLAAADDFEADLLRQVRRQYSHVSAERLLSGIGLPVLHAAVAAVLGQPASTLSAEAVVERGMAASDAACARSLDVFCALLGSFAGNVALTMGARGGVYIGGGIVPRLGERFFASAFRQRFEAKGRFQPYLAAIPTPLITDTLAALSGAALALEQHGR